MNTAVTNICQRTSSWLDLEKENRQHILNILVFQLIMPLISWTPKLLRVDATSIVINGNDFATVPSDILYINFISSNLRLFWFVLGWRLIIVCRSVEWNCVHCIYLPDRLGVSGVILLAGNSIGNMSARLAKYMLAPRVSVAIRKRSL